jgi:hypothetical protein
MEYEKLPHNVKQHVDQVRAAKISGTSLVEFELKTFEYEQSDIDFIKRAISEHASPAKIKVVTLFGSTYKFQIEP